MSSPEFSVIAPCFNEEANVPELTRRVLNVFRRGELRPLLADGLAR